MNLLIWMFFVLPFVTMVWVYDIITTMFKILLAKYYVFAFQRSSYLREREIVDMLVDDPNRISTYNQWSSNN